VATRFTASGLPDIQFDIGRFIAPAQNLDGVMNGHAAVAHGLPHARLLRTPAAADQAEMAPCHGHARGQLPVRAGGVITFVSYGIPYFQRLPGGMNRLAGVQQDAAAAVEHHPVRPGGGGSRPDGCLLGQHRASASCASTFRSGSNRNDVLFTVRGDNQSYVQDAVSWLGGSNVLVGRAIPSPRFGGLLTFTSSRAMFTQLGLPRYVAANQGLRFANFVTRTLQCGWASPTSNVTRVGSGAESATFAGNASARLTTAVPGDYFDNAGIQHLSHVHPGHWSSSSNMDAAGNPARTASSPSAVQYMFRSPAPSQGNPDQFTNGGGPTFIRERVQGHQRRAQHRAGHRGGAERTPPWAICPHCNRSSRAADGPPMHIRIGRAGLRQHGRFPARPTSRNWQFTVSCRPPTSSAPCERNQASLDLAQQFAVPGDENGLERFLTATRRQNFLIPPRRHGRSRSSS